MYALLLDALSSSILLIDAKLRVVSTNRNFLERTRRSASDTVGQPIDKVLPPVILDQMDLTGMIRTVIDLRQATRGEWMVYRAPGVTAHIGSYSLLPFIWEGAVEHVILVLEDVTEQGGRGGEVGRSEHHLAGAVESASDLVVSIDVAGRILTWNKAAERVSGYRREEVCGRLLSELHSERHQGVLRYEIARAARGRAFGTAEWDLVTKSGRLAPVAWVGSPMRDDRELVVGVVAFGRDLTERRQFEARLLR